MIFQFDKNNGMKFCKKCHKIVIETLTKIEEVKVRCRCDSCVRVLGNDGERMLRNSVFDSSCKRTGKKRRVAKEFTDAVRYHAGVKHY